MNKLRRSMGCIAVVLLMLVPAAARAQVMEQVPADAVVVIKIANLQDVSNKIASLAKQLGLADVSPDMANPLGALQENAKLQKGLNTAGDAAFVMFGAAEQWENNFVVLLPVSDYQAFLTNFEGVNTEGDVATFALPDKPGETGYAKKAGTYAMIAPSKPLVEKPAAGAGLKFGPVASRELQERDIVVVTNFAQVRDRLLPKIAKARQDASAQIDKQMQKNAAAGGGQGNGDAAAPAGADPAKMAPIAKAVIDQAFNAVERFVRETDASTFGMDLSDQGIQGALTAEFAQGSYLANLTQQVKNSDESILVGLPATKYIVFGGWNQDPKVIGAALDEFIAPITKELQAAAGDQGQVVAGVIEAARRQLAATTGGTFGVLAPTGPLGASSLVQMVQVTRGDAPAIKAASLEALDAQQKVMTAIGAQGQGGDVQTTITPAAKTLDGVTFDQFQTKINIDATTPQEAQAAQFMAFLYGPNGINGLMGTVDNEHLVSAVGVDDKTLQSVVTAVKGKQNPLASRASVKSVGDQLPKARVGEVYFAVDELVNTAVNYAKQVGLAVPVQLPADLPPIGVAFSTEQSAARVDGFVPSSLVQNLVAVGLQLYMQMQPGQGAGEPGGL